MIQWEEIIAKAAEIFRIDLNLIKAIISTESSWESKAIRFEPTWKLFNRPQYFADKLEIPLADEQKNQATSFGLMQVMGAVARDLGFTDHLEMMLTPEIAIFYGTKKLSQLTKKYDKESDVVSAYNQGNPRMKGDAYENQDYVDKVYGYLNALRG